MSRLRIIACLLAAAACALTGCGPEATGKAQASAPREPAVGLAEYRLAAGPVVIEGVRDNASGLAWSPVTGSLFLVLNGPPIVLELDPDGTPRRRIPLKGFLDTEGIAHVRDDTFVIAEEGRRTLVMVRISPETADLDYAAQTRLLLDPRTGGNTGLEGAAWDPENRRFFGVKEKRPRKIYECAEPTDEAPAPAVEHPWDAERDDLGMSDLSGVCTNAPTGHLLLLSDESRCIVECTTDGREVSRLSLRRGASGLARDVPQAEGIAMDGEGNIYVCSEPNLFYVFKRAQSGD